MIEISDQPQHDSLAKWAWLAAIAPAMLAAMHMHGETDPMRRWVQHLAELAGGHNEPDWVRRLVQRGKGAAGRTDLDPTELTPSIPNIPPHWEKAHLDQLMRHPETQWPPDKVVHNPDGTTSSMRNLSQYSGYDQTVEPQLPTSQKFKELARGSEWDMNAPPTQTHNFTPETLGWAGGSSFHQGANSDSRMTFGRNTLPLDPLELFLAAMGPTNFEKRIKPPPTR